MLNLRLALGLTLCLLATACIKGDDPKAYLGHWKKLKYQHIVLEITDEGNNNFTVSKTDLEQWKRPVKKAAATIKDGVLLIEGTEAGTIQKDGSLLYLGGQYVRQTAAEIEAMKVTLATPQKSFEPF